MSTGKSVALAFNSGLGFSVSLVARTQFSTTRRSPSHLITPLHGAAPCLLRASLRAGDHGAAPCRCRGAAPSEAPSRSVVALRAAPWSLRDMLRGRSVVAPWSLRDRPGPAPCALRMRDSQRATGPHPVPLPACATACTRHALQWPWPWALPVGAAAADTANCTVAAVCAGSTALGVLSICTQEDSQTVFAMLETISDMLIADTLCTSQLQTVFAPHCSGVCNQHIKQCFRHSANTLCKHSLQTLAGAA